MSVRTVRLDDDAEATLAALRKQTGLSISDVLKRGLESYAEAVRDESANTPFDIFSRIDLGPGGYALAPAREAKTAVVETLREKHRR